ncbi:MAG: hypothetical protein EOP48_25130 [Sphingobacteriales bacterium]|nr:MAG: hypothetical protein EOP48_25130 [Sphingobacteriales bacterium]
MIKLTDLSVRQDIAAQEVLLSMGLLEEDTADNRVTLQVYDSELQARANGWTSANAYLAVIRRVVEKMPPRLATRLILKSCNHELGH